MSTGEALWSCGEELTHTHPLSLSSSPPECGGHCEDLIKGPISASMRDVASGDVMMAVWGEGALKEPIEEEKSLRMQMKDLKRFEVLVCDPPGPAEQNTRGHAINMRGSAGRGPGPRRRCAPRL